MGTPIDRPGRGTLVLPLLVGWWLGAGAASCVEDAAVRRLERSLHAGPAPRVDSLAGRPPLAYPRALRVARGVGRRRSVDLARHLWDRGPEAPIETLSGFGPRTAAAAHEALREIARSR